MKEIELSKKDKKHQIKENKKREADFMAALELQRENKAQTLKKIAERSKLINALTADIKEDSPYRSISIGSLGIVNFDLPITLPAKGVNVPADFVISQTSTSVGAVSLIDLSNKTFYTYRKENFKEFRLRKNTEYIIVSILPDGQLAAYKSRLNSEQFKNGTPHRFILEKAPKYESLEELKEFLGIDFIDA